jgi:hypothetical protein
MELSSLIHQPAIIKILIFFLIWVGIWLPIAVVSAILLNWHPPQPLHSQQKIILLASLYLVVPFLLAEAAHLEQHSFLDYGWVGIPQMGISISQGFIMGGLSLTLLSIVQWQFQVIQWQQSSMVETQQTAAAPGFTLGGMISIGLIAVWISATEELVFRGFLQFQLQQDYPPWEAAAIASTLFALSHLLWNWKDTVPQLPGLWLMGMVLKVACICDRGSLGLAIGLHASWIWGIALTEQLFVSSSTPNLPQWLIGRINQPLASLSSWMMLLTLAGGLILFYPD